MFDQFYQYLEKLLNDTKNIKLLQILLKIYTTKNNLEKQKFIVQKILFLQPKNQKAKVKIASILLHQKKINQAQEILKGIDPPQQINDITYLQYIQKNIHISKKDQNDKDGQNDLKKQIKKKIKKKKKVKLPQNTEYIQGFKPDPYRWLPKWQRKGYKKKGKKMGKNQGLITVDKEQTKNLYTTAASTSTKEVTKQFTKKRRT